MQAKKVTEEEVMSSEDGDDEVEIIKEVHSSATRTLKQMVESTKRHPGLRSTSWRDVFSPLLLIFSLVIF